MIIIELYFCLSFNPLSVRWLTTLKFAFASGGCRCLRSYRYIDAMLNQSSSMIRRLTLKTCIRIIKDIV
jgi:hypothetical protein